jgi:hypothetical protein
MRLVKNRVRKRTSNQNATLSATSTALEIYIFVKLQLGFSPVAVVQQQNRQATHITHIQSTNTIQKHNNK